MMPTLRTVAETVKSDFRTDPAALALPTLAGPIATEALQNMYESPSRAALLGASALATVGAGVWHARRSFQLKSRLQELLTQHGWDERLLKGPVKEWCGRQVGKLACEQTGYSGQYSELVEKTKNEQQFKRIPSI